MAFAINLQSAPEARGTIGDPSSWAGASTTTPTTAGQYTGTTEPTFTITGPNGVGTIGTGTVLVTWSDGTSTGSFDLGADYTAGDDVNLPDGIVLQFSAGNIQTGDTFTFTVGAARRVRQDHVRIDGTADPMDVAPTFVTVQDDDFRFASQDGRLSFAEVAQRLQVSLELDYADDTEYRKLAIMRANRHPVTLYGNYDDSTSLWYPGFGDLPAIGGAPTLTRATVAYGRDPDSGKARYFASGAKRYGPGVEQTSDARTNDYEREWQPLVDDHVGRALILGPARTHVLTQSHPKSGTLGWTATGSAVITWDTDVPPMLDQDDTNIAAEFRKGSMRAHIPAPDTIITANATVSASTSYCAQVWVRASGAGDTVIVATLLSGTGTPGTSIGAVATSAGESDGWVRIVLSGTTGVGHNVAAIRLSIAAGTVLLWVSGSTIATKRSAGEWAETDGSTLVQNGDSMPWDDAIPQGEGSLAFWLYWGGDDGGSTYSILATSGAPAFKLDWDAANNQLEWHTDSSGVGNALVKSVGDWAPYTWHHVALVWASHGTGGFMRRKIYFDGSLVGGAGDETSDWDDWNDPWRFAGDVWASDGRIQDVRLDRREWTAAEVADIYNRFATDKGKYLVRMMTGRTFRIASVSESWLHPSHPDKQRVSLLLEEWDRDDDHLVVSA